MKLTFLGAAGTVTGSKYLLSGHGKKILVDCGLYQGLKELRLRNWHSLPIDPAEIDMVVLTHAHIDHSGYLPLLVKNGFTGPIYSTEATYELCKILLPDSGHIHEEDAKRANKYGYSKHHPALPLYTKLDAIKALKQFKVVQYEHPLKVNSDIDIIWHRAGHILGSAFIEFHFDNLKMMFTGDMGRPNDDVMLPPVKIRDLDYLIIESTYGDRLHDKEKPQKQLADIINATVKIGGSVLMPAFAVGRAQTLLYYLSMLKAGNQIPDIPIYLDSPMAINVTQLLCRFSDEHKLTSQMCERACNVAKYTLTVDDSKMIDHVHKPKIVISASGMATGGRVLHHLRVMAPDKRNTILLTGYQAEETRGDRILKGERQVKMLGEMVDINARVAELTNISVHPDYEEILAWLKNFDRPPKKIFITHGEKDASASLKIKIENELGWECVLPSYLEEVILG